MFVPKDKLLDCLNNMMGPTFLCSINHVTSFICSLIPLFPIAVHIKHKGLHVVNKVSWPAYLFSTVSSPVSHCLQHSVTLASLSSLELVKLLSILEPLQCITSYTWNRLCPLFMGLVLIFIQLLVQRPSSQNNLSCLPNLILLFRCSFLY